MPSSTMRQAFNNRLLVDTRRLSQYNTVIYCLIARSAQMRHVDKRRREGNTEGKNNQLDNTCIRLCPRRLFATHLF